MSRCPTRGSVAVFSLIMVAFTALIVMVSIEMAGQNRTRQKRTEAQRITQNAFDGVYDYLVSQGDLNSQYTFPTTLTFSVDSVSGSYTITDNSSALTGTLWLTGSISYQGKTYRFKKIIGGGKKIASNTASLGAFGNALFCNNYLNLSSSITVGSSTLPGDAYAYGINANASGTHFYHNLSVVSNVNGTFQVDGTYTKPAPTQTFPTISSNDYYTNAASVSTNNSATINGMTFPSVASSASYPIYYYPNDIYISGVFYGRGVIYAGSNLVINGDITLGPNSSLVLVTPNQIAIQGSTSKISAYMYCGSSFSCSTTVSVFGALVTNNMNLSSSGSYTYDSYMSTTAGEAKRLRIPGQWP